ncbi:MAG: YidB family protein, partial [Betaproteobacteria bacterium]
AAPGGGLGDLGGLLGQMMGGGAPAAGGLGGLGELLGRIQQAGYGEQARSWVSTGQNMPIDADAIGRIFGNDGLADIARRAGLSELEVSRGLSELLPEVVDRLTPSGSLPEAGMFDASLADLQRRLGL